MLTSCSRSHSLRFLLTMALALSLAASSWPRPQRAAAAPAEVPAQTNAGTEQQGKEAYGKLGVSFEENRGQVDEKVRFLSRHGGATVFLTGDEAAFVLSAPQSRASASGERLVKEKGLPEARARRGRGAETREGPKLHAMRMKFEGANPAAEVSGEHELQGRVNYFRGSDPSKWQAGVRTYGAVRYRGIYDGVDLAYYGNEQGEMEYDFVVAAGADPRQISLRIEGAKAVKVDAAGYLVMSTPVGEMRQRRPTVYQEVGGARREVAGGYEVAAGGRVRFALGEYDQSAPLVIDPVLEYSTYLGVDLGDAAPVSDSAVDSAGNTYYTGETYSADFPTKNPIQGEFAGHSDVFVTKVGADGAVVYSTYLGGWRRDAGQGIAADSAGNAYVMGYTFSDDFPVINGEDFKDKTDVFVAKINADGSALLYSTCFGSGHDEYGYDIALDSAGNAYVTGWTDAGWDFPGMIYNEGETWDYEEIFVLKFSPTGGYAIMIRGNGHDVGYHIAADSAGNAYVMGYTDSTDFPTKNPLQGTPHGGSNAFLLKFNADGSNLIYSTYFGGSGNDGISAVAGDSAGNAYVVGGTDSADFPTKNSLQTLKGSDAFVTKINADGSAFIYSTFLGGSGEDGASDIAVDSAGNAYTSWGAPTRPTSPWPTLPRARKVAPSTHSSRSSARTARPSFTRRTSAAVISIMPMASRWTRQAAPTSRASPARPTSP